MRKHITYDLSPIPFPMTRKIIIKIERLCRENLGLSALLVATLLLAVGCSKSSDQTPVPKATLATVSTFDVGARSQTTGSSGGWVLDDGGSPVTILGICWSITSNPTIDNSKTTLNANDFGSFVSFATGLIPATTYYVRAYATNGVGTAYGEEVHFSTLAESDTSVTDINGNFYHVLKIGSQTWMLENLKTTNYQNGDAIGLDNGTWGIGAGTGGAYTIYNNDQSNIIVYGRLYNWYAGVDSRKIAPVGWHVPSREEYETLISFLGGSSVAGGEMKETGLAHWVSPNTGANNSSGFNGLPTGSRLNTGEFNFIGTGGYWWTTTEDFADANAVLLKNDAADALIITGNKQSGAAIRCIKD